MPGWLAGDIWLGSNLGLQSQQSQYQQQLAGYGSLTAGTNSNPFGIPQTLEQPATEPEKSTEPAEFRWLRNRVEEILWK